MSEVKLFGKMIQLTSNDDVSDPSCGSNLVAVVNSERNSDHNLSCSNASVSPKSTENNKGNVMHCIARSVIAHCVVPKLQVGDIYNIRRFTLEQNKDAYRVRRDDPFLIQLEANTVIDKLDCSSLGFIRQPFHLQPIEEIAFNGHKYLIDVVGRVINLGEWKATSNNSHYLHFHLINERGRSIKVTLWGSLGEELLRRCGGPDALYVIVLPAMQVREYRGAIQIQSTLGTMIFDDHRIPEIAAIRELMKEAVPPPDNNGNLRHLLLLGREQHGVNQMQSMTIMCCVKIVGIHPQSTWTYNSCGESGCKKGLKPVENQLYCDVCAKYCEFPLLRYRLRLQVSDESTTLVVTLFDEVAEALIQKKSTVIIQEMVGHTEENEYPTEILQLVGSTYVFEFKTHMYYNHGQYDSFTVARVVTGVQVGEIKNRAYQLKLLLMKIETQKWTSMPNQAQVQVLQINQMTSTSTVKFCRRTGQN